MLECPKCHSKAITLLNNDLLCLTCGMRENLYDYPIATPALKKDEGITDTEEDTNLPLPTRKQWSYLHQLQGQVNFLQNKLNTHLDKKSTKRPAAELKEIEL